MSLDAMKQALAALNDYEPNEAHKVATALRAAIEQAQDPETELETYKRLYELRGKALERPCSNCGHQPAKIKAMAQPEQEPVAWMHKHIENNIITHRPADLDRHPDRWEALYKTPPPCPTCEALARTVMMDQTSHDMAPRQWQGLTEDEKNSMVEWAHPDIIDAIELKLRERNT